MRILAALFVALCPMVVSAGEWLTDYSKAFELSKSADKPIFVYFTDSAQDKNWENRFDGLGELTDRYVTVVADKSDKGSSELFKSFEIAGNHGAVVVERDRQWQYFRTARELNKTDLTKVLTDCKEAKGKPAASVLTSVSSSEEIPASTGSNTIRSFNDCPNCRRFR